MDRIIMQQPRRLWTSKIIWLFGGFKSPASHGRQSWTANRRPQHVVQLTRACLMPYEHPTLFSFIKAQILEVIEEILIPCNLSAVGSNGTPQGTEGSSLTAHSDDSDVGEVFLFSVGAAFVARGAESPFTKGWISCSRWFPRNTGNLSAVFVLWLGKTKGVRAFSISIERNSAISERCMTMHPLETIPTAPTRRDQIGLKVMTTPMKQN